ncbi:3-oxoacyl-[acyl-carrier-protein] reductase FabG [Camellia lanceoleosa]|uniref:3-oxoacyl-[acyl-carrier-protein] reductase FabG n=1 Tax=Camellia lanceoleosa TaxID=1840588 RepID=A0ACC0FQW8_9ERIC|nr:3-oxoacyl-[acyl-carrier-protein] reductase FabG [Camellia lanceoleosa]
MASQLEPWRHLGDKVVMVTGASSGIGLDFCLDLAKAGCKIIAAARRIDRLESLCDKINRLSSDSAGSSSIRAVAVELDVSADGPAIESAVQKAWDAFGTIDALINNAGVRGSVKSVLNLSEDEWNSIIKTNMTGLWLVTKYVCLRMLAANKGGSVINISSIAGLSRGHLPGSLAYTASKAAVNTMTKMMAIELGENKIRVNAISPGLFKSEITEGLMQKNWLKNVALRTVPLREYGTVDPALTSLVRYLIHDSSEYISGNIFIVDAGATLPGVPIFSSL